MNDKVLVVDDDKTTTSMITSGLEKNGYITHIAGDGEKGLAMAAEVRPDLVILDIEMPNMNGYNFIHDFRKIEGFQDTPVVVLTSHQDMKPIFDLKGVSDYLTKPIKLDELISKVHGLLKD